MQENAMQRPLGSPSSGKNTLQCHKGSCTVETACSDHGYIDQPIIGIKKLGTESFLHKCRLNNLFTVIK